jgi:hypothetical protein
MRGWPRPGGPIKTRLYGRGEEAAWAVKLVKVITGEEPRVTPMSDGRFRIRDTGRHIDAMAQYEELREAIEEWSNQHRGGQ